MRALLRAIRALRAEPEQDPEDHGRSPDWCHSHGKWRQDEEES